MRVAIFKMMEGPDQQFMRIVDELIFQSQSDSELREGLKWIDEQAFKNEVGFYEMALQVLRKYVAEKRAKEWLEAKAQ